ncbi:hypothetical protein AgCh_033560 [Apium graveolens]
MNVKFFEHLPYYTKTNFEGENACQSQIEFWESDLPSPVFSRTVEFEHIPSPVLPRPVESEPLTSSSNENVPKTTTKSRGTPGHNNESDLKPVHPANQSSDTLVEHVTEKILDVDDGPIALRKGKRTCTKHSICKFVSMGKLSPKFKAFTAQLDRTSVPKDIHEALKHPRWKAAVHEEIKALEKNGTWDITELPPGKSEVGCKWLFTVKYLADGSIDRFKARLVARGFTQTYGVDYKETFDPVAKLNTVKVLISLAVNNDWPLQQLDVKNVFLNGDLNKEVYKTILPGFVNHQNKNKVCRLRKSIYGLKQSPRTWSERLSDVMKRSGYTQSQSDDTMFFRFSHNAEFEIKDLGSLKYFLGMEIARTKDGVSMSQRKYVLDLLQETGMLGCKPATTTMEYNVKLDYEEKSPPVDKGRYQRLVGKLIYLTHTRPDISFPVSVVSQFMHCLKEKHLESVYRILRYLKMTPGKGLFLGKHSDQGIEVYIDSDWAGSTIDRRSTSGYCTYVGGNLVTWRSKKQSVVARSSAEAKFRAIALGVCEALWLKRILEELRMTSKPTINMFCDNQAALSIARNPVHHDRTKHIEIDRNFIKVKIDKGIINMLYIPTRSQIADMLTKALSRQPFEELTAKLGMINIYSSV